jgi:hypothetical protein
VDKKAFCVRAISRHYAASAGDDGMCNLYSMVSNKEAIREFAKFLRVTPEMDNLPTFPGIFANGWAPIADSGMIARTVPT